MTDYQTVFSHEEIALNRKRVAEMIKCHPNQHYQGDWVHVLDGTDDRDIEHHRPSIGHLTVGELAENCGTQCCIAGWTAVLTLPRDMPFSQFTTGYNTYARQALGIHRQVASYLFYDIDEPEAAEFMEWLAEHPDSDGRDNEAYLACWGDDNEQE